MPETDMPPQYAGTYADPKDTEGKVLAAARALAANNVNLWATLVLDAVSEFETAANNHIEQLQYNTDATYDFNPVLSSFAKVAVDFFPPTKAASSIVSTVMGGIQSAYDDKLKSGLTEGKLKLHASVVALVQAARERATAAASAIQEKLPEAVEDGMTWVDSASTDPDYVAALCAWMGFPLATRENTVNPIRQALENPFFGVYQAVRAQLLRTQGVAGLDDDQLNPISWEHEAIVTQQKAYDDDGPSAWEKVYQQ